MPSEREVRLAENEVLFRELNATIRGEGGRSPYEFVCECSDLACQEKIAMSLAAYREVRSDPQTFFVRPDHDIDDVEDVVERAEDYWVVRKHDNVEDVVET